MSDNTFLLSVYTPDALVFSEQVTSFTFEGLDGQLCIMKNHEPMLVALKQDKVRIGQNGSYLLAVSGEGCLEVSKNRANLYVSRFLLRLTPEQAEEELKHLKEKALAEHREHLKTELELVKMIGKLSEKKK